MGSSTCFPFWHLKNGKQVDDPIFPDLGFEIVFEITIARI